ncbi:LysM peptidoglycan-binding domain-containing protein [Marinicellulosiphila megalodicopiae]|uniref:LysM peptidoglycan-binding domain-containing protein n=1 Tax=Marinicellulosiphila megalodicopiae TaxID=2724896 RepID=UPI003BAF3DD9
MEEGDSLQIKQDAPEKYTVVKGDTLWNISSMYLHSPWRWPEIWSYNEYIENPHLIYPGDVLFLNCDDMEKCKVSTVGQQFIDNNNTDSYPGNTTNQNGSSNNSNNDDYTNNNWSSGNDTISAISNSDTDSTYVRADGTVVLVPKPIVVPTDSAIQTIPREHIEFFLNRNQVVNPADIENKPHILASRDGRLVLGGGDRIYAVGTFDSNITNYMVYRKGELHKDPDTKEVLGLEIRSLGLADYVEEENGVHSLTLQNTQFNIRVGDFLYPVQNNYIEPFYTPSAPSGDIRAHILSVSRGVSAIGQYDVVLISKGTRDGLEVGNMLSIVQNGGTAVDPKTRLKYKLPNVEAGLAMIFSVDEKTSYALILEAFNPIRVGDLGISPK